MPYQVGLVTYSSAVHAWVLDLPGAIAGARDVDGLHDILPLVIAEHAAWVRANGGVASQSTEWRVTETIDGESLVATGGEWCFDYDRARLDAVELEDLIVRMKWSRAELLEAPRGLPDELLDWAPPACDTSSFDAWAPEVRTIREILVHVLQLEAYYRGGLRDGPSTGIFEPVAEEAAERERTLALLRAMSDEERSRAYRPVRPSRSTPEDWTVRKLARRIIAHERGHAAEIRQRLTWVLLGTPCLR